MSWVKTSDTFVGWDVWERLGPAPYFLHMAALSHCNQQGSDGRLTRARAITLTPVVEDAAAAVSALLAAGVWRLLDETTIQVAEYVNDLRSNHGRGDEQPTAGALKAKREADAERLRRWREARAKKEAEAKAAAGNGVSSPVSNNVQSCPDLAVGLGQVSTTRVGNGVSNDTPISERPECEHGMAGGYDRVQGGGPRCPLCRRAA